MAERTAPVEVQWPGSAALADGVPDGWHMRGSAATKVGRSKDTLKTWQNDGTYEPSGYMMRGSLCVWLYSDKDIENMIEIAAHKRPGRPPKEEKADA